jgi:hypothetical protein
MGMGGRALKGGWYSRSRSPEGVDKTDPCGVESRPEGERLGDGVKMRPFEFELTPRPVDGGVTSSSRYCRVPRAKGGASGVWMVEAGARIGERSATGSAPSVAGDGTRGAGVVRGEMAL